MNGRTALGAAFVLLAVLAGALFLDCAQRLVPVYAAARDLPAGTPPKSGDLLVVPYDQQNRPFHFIEIIAAGGRIEFSYLYGTPSRRATTDL